MTFDRAEWEKARKENEEKRFRDLMPRLELMRQGAVAAELLTGNVAWDAFLRYLQGAIDVTREQMSALEKVLFAPDLVDQVRLLQVKVSVLRCAERIAAWEAVMQLPRELGDNGEIAASLVERMEKIGADDRRGDEQD